MKAAIYARFSSNNQREASIDDQMRICREYCSKSGLTVVAEYADHAISGLTDARPDFQRMIKDGERGVFEVLVCYAMDRFARDKYDSAMYKARLKKKGVKIAYVTTPVGEGPEAVLMESLLEGMAQYYSENLARSVRRGLEGNALKGLITGGSCPYGYKIVNRNYEIDPVQAEIVRRVFSEYASGASISEIVRKLNAEGRRTASGNPFTPNSFCGWWQNETYLGVFHWRDVRIENHHPAIIDRDLFDRVQQMRAHNKMAKAKAKAKEDYLLTGKAFCGHCGAWLIGESGRNHAGVIYNYYSCSNHKRAKGCPKKPERKADLEALVVRACRAALTDEAIALISEKAAASLAAEAQKNDLTPALKKELREVENKIKNIMAAIEDGIYTATTKDRLTELEARNAALEADILKASAPAPTLTADMIAFWLSKFRAGDTTSPDYIRTLIDALLNSITLFDGKESKKAVLTFNLEGNTARRTLTGSDIDEIVGLYAQNPNFVIYKKLFCIVVDVPLIA